jgi:RNA polymerase sigma-70 factor, ECF subfamily
VNYLESSTELAARSGAHSLAGREDPSDFAELALPLFESVYNFARWLARNDADAEDLAQEVYLRAFRSFSTFEPGSNLKAWLFRILKNTFLSSRAKAQHRYAALLDFDEVLTTLPANSPDPVTTLVEKSRLEAVLAATQRLPIPLRDVLVLCDLEELTYRQAAQVLAIPVGTVMSRLARARRAVRKSLHPTHHTVSVVYRSGAFET